MAAERVFVLEIMLLSVIIGCLAAMALPKFIGLGAEATQAKVNSLAAAITTAAATNALAAKARSPKAVLVNGQACSSLVLDQILGSPIAPPYLIYAEAPASGDCSGAGGRESVSCILYMLPPSTNISVGANFTVACVR